MYRKFIKLGLKKKKNWAEGEVGLRGSHSRNSPYTVGSSEAGRTLHTIRGLPRGAHDLGQGALFS